ncbi:unnamed protein product, partial [Prorocentrum cordatum]
VAGADALPPEGAQVRGAGAAAQDRLRLRGLEGPPAAAVGEAARLRGARRGRSGGAAPARVRFCVARLPRGRMPATSASSWRSALLFEYGRAGSARASSCAPPWGGCSRTQPRTTPGGRCSRRCGGGVGRSPGPSTGANLEACLRLVWERRQAKEQREALRRRSAGMGEQERPRGSGFAFAIVLLSLDGWMLQYVEMASRRTGASTARCSGH